MLFNSSDWADENLHEIVKVVETSVAVEQSVESLKDCRSIDADVGVNKLYIGAIDKAFSKKLFNYKNDIPLTRYSVHSLRPANPILFAATFLFRNFSLQLNFARKVCK